MLPFAIELRSGTPIYEQVTYAARRAVLRGELAAGDAFPSVRALSQGLRINPNTAHKVVAALTAEGLLEVRPGIGTVVSARARGSPEKRAALLRGELERLVVDARRLGLTEEQVFEAVHRHWSSLSSDPFKPDDLRRHRDDARLQRQTGHEGHRRDLSPARRGPAAH